MSHSTTAPPVWVQHPGHSPSAAAELARAHELPLAMAHVLVNRGVRDRDDMLRFLDPVPEYLHDPTRMKGLEAAAERIERAIRDGETIFIQGDYDVDGITSTFLLYRVLTRELGGRAEYFIPDRLTDGYGLTVRAVEDARARGCSLIVTVDCGITAHEPVAHARGLGIDVVVTDHHEPTSVLPAAVAVVNPLQPGCPYPYKHLAGVGVTFKLVERLLRERDEASGDALGRAGAYLDVVALGTIADVVPLTGENRVLARLGLDRLNAHPRLGLDALRRQSPQRRFNGGATPPLNSTHVAFQLAPRINAAGRMGRAADGVRLLLAETEAEAGAIARELELLNQSRRDEDSSLRDEAVQRVERQISSDPGRRSIVLWDESWHPGVIGIVASRLVEKYHLPTVLVSLKHGSGRGSCRSIAGVDLTRVLQGCDDLLLAHGGHAFAAGLSIAPDRLEEFRERFDRLVTEAADEDRFATRIRYEAELAPQDCTLELVQALERLAPFGLDNPEPVFRMDGVRLLQPREVGQGRHLRFDVHAPGGRGRETIEAIGFGFAERFALSGLRSATRADLLVVPSRNEWMGQTRLQLKLRDLRIVG